MKGGATADDTAGTAQGDVLTSQHVVLQSGPVKKSKMCVTGSVPSATCSLMHSVRAALLLQPMPWQHADVPPFISRNKATTHEILSRTQTRAGSLLLGLWQAGAMETLGIQVSLASLQAGSLRGLAHRV